MNTTDVDVIVYVQKTGKLKPLYIVWEDPRSGEKTNYKIEKITYHLEMPAGNHTWHVVIRGAETPAQGQREELTDQQRRILMSVCGGNKGGGGLCTKN